MGSKNDTPPPPDYRGAAIEQGKANKEAAVASAMLSNPNINNPYGTRTVSYSPGPDGNMIPTINESFSPEEQAKYDANNAITMALYGTAQGGLGRVNDMMNQNFDTSGFQDFSAVDTSSLPDQYSFNLNSLPDRYNFNLNQLPKLFQGKGELLPSVDALTAESLPELGDASVGGLSNVADAIRQLGSTGIDQRESKMRADLAARGFSPGAEGFDAEMRNLGQQRNDLELQSLLAAGQEQSRINRDLLANRGALFGERKDIYSSQNRDEQREFERRAWIHDNARTNRQLAMNEQMQMAGLSDARRSAALAEQMGYAGLTEGQRTNLFNQMNAAAQTNANTRGRQLQEAQFLRQLPLSEINALRTGGQPMLPQFQQYSGQSIQAAPLFDASIAQGNYDMTNYANRSDTMGGLFSLGGALLGAAGGAGGFSSLFG